MQILGKRSHVIMWALLAVLALAALVGIARAVRGPHVSVGTAVAGQGPLERRVSADGVMQSRADIDVYTPVQTTVERIFVADGQRVSRGQPLVSLDREPFVLAKVQALAAYRQAESGGHIARKGDPTSADYDAAKAAVDAARRTLWAARKKHEAAKPTLIPGPTGVTAVPADSIQLRVQLAEAEAGYRQAVAARRKLDVAADLWPELAAADTSAEQARLAYRKAVRDLRQTTVRAPVDGSVFLQSSTGSGAQAVAGLALQGPQRKLSRGQAVGPSAPLLRIVDERRMKFVADVDESDIVSVRRGQRGVVTLDAFADRAIPGAVRRVSVLSKTTQSGGSAFAVELLPARLAPGLKIGMNGTAEIVVARRERAVQAPLQAVTHRDGQDVVFVVTGGVARVRVVKLGFAGDSVYEVRSGLRAGERIVTSGLKDLTDGAAVREQSP